MTSLEQEQPSPSIEFELKPTPVPKVVVEESKRIAERGLQKQRKILASLIFPNHIPQACFPDVTSFADLLQELKEAANRDAKVSSHAPIVNTDTSCDSSFSRDDLQKLRSNPTNDAITPLKEAVHVHDRCDVFLRRAEKFEKEADKKKEEGAEKNDILEALSMSKISHMNYSYCIASVSCPRRIAIFENCFQQYSRDVISAVAKEGQHKFLCQKERKGVERCCGQKVQSVMRKLLE